MEFSLDKLKTQAPIVDSDKEDTIVVRELRALETVAYRLPGGRELGEWVGFVLGRPTRAQRTRSTQYSQLLNPMWQVSGSKKDKKGSSSKESNSEGSGAEDSQHTSVEYRFTDKDQLPGLSIELDGRLFPWLQSMLRGKLSAVLYGLPIEVFSAGIWALYNSIQGSKLLLKWAALDDLEALTFDAEDVKSFKVKYQLLVSDVERYKITGKDIAQRKLLRCGIPKYVAKDIAKDLAAEGDVNVMDVLSSHLDALDATVSQAELESLLHPGLHNLNIAANAANVAAVHHKAGACSRCGRDGHTAEDCFSNVHVNKTRLDPATKTANGERLGQEYPKQMGSRNPGNRSSNAKPTTVNSLEMMAAFKGMNAEAKRQLTCVAM